jgi:hypothetical protein
MITPLLLSIFFIGYFLITIEHYIKINKAAFALLIAVVSWVILIFNSKNYQEVKVALATRNQE